MKYTEKNPPACKCGRKMELRQEVTIVPIFFWESPLRGIFTEYFAKLAELERNMKKGASQS